MQDLAALRRDKLTAIIGKAHERLQGVLMGAGIDPAIARMIAATRVYQLLPTEMQQQMTAIEVDISTRMAPLIRDVAGAADAATIKAVPDR